MYKGVFRLMEIDFDYLDKLSKKNAYLDVLCELTETKIDTFGKADETGLAVAIGIVKELIEKLGV